MAKTETLYEQCEKIYEKSGQGAVLDFISKKHPEVKWGYCEDCECDSPKALDSKSEPYCLVCGSSNML